MPFVLTANQNEFFNCFLQKSTHFYSTTTVVALYEVMGKFAPVKRITFVREFSFCARARAKPMFSPGVKMLYYSGYTAVVAPVFTGEQVR